MGHSRSASRPGGHLYGGGGSRSLWRPLPAGQGRKATQAGMGAHRTVRQAGLDPSARGHRPPPEGSSQVSQLTFTESLRRALAAGLEDVPRLTELVPARRAGETVRLGALRLPAELAREAERSSARARFACVGGRSARTALCYPVRPIPGESSHRMAFALATNEPDAQAAARFSGQGGCRDSPCVLRPTLRSRALAPHHAGGSNSRGVRQGRRTPCQTKSRASWQLFRY